MLLKILFFSFSTFAQSPAVTNPIVPEVKTDSAAALKASQAALVEATLDLEWEKIEDASAYEIKLTPSSGGAALKFLSTTTRLTQKLPVGSYNLQIRSKEKDTGYFGSWSPATEVEVMPKLVKLISPKEGTEISEPKEKRAQVNFEWTPVQKAKEYTLRIWFDEEKNAREFKSTTTKKTLSLPTAKAYAWQVTFLTDKAVGYLAAPQIGNFKVLGKQLLKPVITEKLMTITQDPAAQPPNSQQMVKWKPSPSAKDYYVKLYSKALDEQEWHLLKEDPKHETTQINFEKLRPADYKIEVIAKAPNRVSSEAAKFEFTAKPTEAELAEAMKKAL